MSLPMRIGFGQFKSLTPRKIRFIRQLGIKDLVLNTPTLPGKNSWKLNDLKALKASVKKVGLRLVSLENVPLSFYQKAILGKSERDAQIRHMSRTIQNIGKAGIPILGYHWMGNLVWRSRQPAVVRGGARAPKFDMREHKNAPLTQGKVYTDGEIWENYCYYMERILPVAEKAKVRLALHPDDPPVASLGGIARIFRNFSAFKKALEKFNSPMHGLNFCIGCWSEMGPEGVLKAIQFFGRKNKIIYVHFRDVNGKVPCFNECFLGDGNLDTYKVMMSLKKVGFTGFIIPDHVPEMGDDNKSCDRGWAYTIGYMKALLEAVNHA